MELLILAISTPTTVNSFPFASFSLIKYLMENLGLSFFIKTHFHYSRQMFPEMKEVKS